jgi:3-oxoacyl-[acyl-carrier protein] reductase
MNIELTGKKAFVCGASRGIGRAIAIELARCGARVTALARDESKLRELAKELEELSGLKHSYLAADLLQTEKTISVTKKLLDSEGPIHILINNSGGPPAGLIHEAKPEDFISAFTQHLIASHVMMQCVIEGMKAEKYGRIINIVSTSVKEPIPGLGVSNTIRGAIASWSKTLAGEIAEFGITVNNILPTHIETDRLWNLFKFRASRKNIPFEEEVERERFSVPAKRLGKPEEVAQAVAFLASPAAAYINGINLPIDGGKTSCL